jgi:hypothetical protein
VRSVVYPAASQFLTLVADLIDGLHQVSAPTITLPTIVRHVFTAARSILTSTTEVRDSVRAIFVAIQDRITDDPVQILHDMIDGLEAAANFGLTSTITEVFIAADALTSLGFGTLVLDILAAAKATVTTSATTLIGALWNGLRVVDDGRGDKTVLRAIVAAALAQLSVSLSTLAVIFDDLSGISYAEMVDAFDVGAGAGVSAIADALAATSASATQIMQALEAELDVDRYDTAAQLRRLGYGIIPILEALIAVYAPTYSSAVSVLKFVGFSASQIASVICNYFSC